MEPISIYSAVLATGLAFLRLHDWIRERPRLSVVPQVRPTATLQATLVGRCVPLLTVYGTNVGVRTIHLRGAFLETADGRVPLPTTRLPVKLGHGDVAEVLADEQFELPTVITGVLLTDSLGRQWKARREAIRTLMEDVRRYSSPENLPTLEPLEV